MDLKISVIDMSKALVAQVEAQIVRRAHKVKNRRERQMKAIAPVKTGKYKRGLSGEVTNTPGELSIELGGTDWKTPLIEWDGKKRKGKHIIEKGLRGIEAEMGEGVVADIESVRDLC